MKSLCVPTNPRPADPGPRGRQGLADAVKRDVPHLLAVNPWIHDFAAYDFWARPLGLLYLAAIARRMGMAVTHIDCLDRFHPLAPAADPKARFGRGPYLKTPIAPPAGIGDVARRYARYGIKPQWLEDRLRAITRPDMVLVTGIMSYWAGGVAETIAAIRRVWPQAPVIVGGIYASLWPAHARQCSGADEVITGAAETLMAGLVARHTGYVADAGIDPGDMDSYPRPALDLQEIVGFVPLLTGKGCPFNCPYCASSRLNPLTLRRRPEAVVEELRYWHKDFGVTDVVFYDDALLADPEAHARPLLEAIAASGLRLRFHTPNALHLRFIDSPIAALMKRCGFATIRLGLESGATGPQRLDAKVGRGEFARAVGHLRAAGFDGRQIGVYLMAGLPGQDFGQLEQDIAAVKAAGVSPILTHYTPIPGTGLWEAAKAASRYDLQSDPVFTNNAIWPCRQEPFDWKTLSRLKVLTETDIR